LRTPRKPGGKPIAKAPAKATAKPEVKPASSSQPRQRQTHWDPVAKWYNGWVGKRGSLYHRAVALPTVMDLADPKAGELLLDLGCGQGVLAPHVLRKGARYQGVDGSRTLIQLARRHHGEGPKAREAAQFILGDVRKLASLTEIQAGGADVAVFMLSVQDMDPLEEVLAAAAWALKPAARIVIFMLHPAFRVPRQSGWGYDPGRKLTYRRVDSYLTPRGVPMKAYAEVSARPSGTTMSFHRPLKDYVNTLSSLGFFLEHLDELPDPNVEPSTKKETLDIPLFAALKARRLQ
jgi:SAM-dependent methyltransferase